MTEQQWLQLGLTPWLYGRTFNEFKIVDRGHEFRKQQGRYKVVGDQFYELGARDTKTEAKTLIVTLRMLTA